MITIEKLDYGNYQEVRGCINHREIISMNNSIQGKWGVSCSAILPWDLEEAKDILECYNQVFNKVSVIMRTI